MVNEQISITDNNHYVKWSKGNFQHGQMNSQDGQIEPETYKNIPKSTRLIIDLIINGNRASIYYNC